MTKISHGLEITGTLPEAFKWFLKVRAHFPWAYAVFQLTRPKNGFQRNIWIWRCWDLDLWCPWMFIHVRSFHPASLIIVGHTWQARSRTREWKLSALAPVPVPETMNLVCPKKLEKVVDPRGQNRPLSHSCGCGWLSGPVTLLLYLSRTWTCSHGAGPCPGPGPALDLVQDQDQA